MTTPFPPTLVALIVLGSTTCTLALESQSGRPKTLIAFDTGFTLKSTNVQDAVTKVERVDATTALRVATGHKVSWPGITIKAPESPWNLSDYTTIAMNVRNLDSSPVTVYCRVDSPGGDGEKNSITGHVTLDPNEQKTLKVELSRQLPVELAKKLYGMRGYPGGAKERGIDASRITQLTIFVNRPKQNHLFQVGTIQAQDPYAQGDWAKMSTDRFFPMIDRFGQFVHKQWPGKTRSKEDLKRDIRQEQQDLASHPGPTEWTQYGGWKDGPQLEATGYFFPVKYRDMWWLVDPEGRLFWSHGVDCVGFSHGATPITDREFYYMELPDKNSPLSKFYGKGSWAPHGYYKGKAAYRTFSFSGANLMRKYGDLWYDRAANLSHRRLRSWSMNTIANWSDSGVYLRRQTPYVVSAHSGGAKRIEGSVGHWGKFPDPFDPSFRQALDRGMRWQEEKSAKDPWCLGYFVDNELTWGNELSLAIATLTSPPEQSAKQIFLADLEKKYKTIQKLNDTWETFHKSWAALSESRTPPDAKNAREDLGAFYTRIAEEYFRHCRDAVKQVAPDNLYLGCRFSSVNDRVAQAAVKYCDVIGYNLYRRDVEEFKLPEGLDKPVIIGEFHFGAFDRGMFHTGLQSTASQKDRAMAYRNYVTSALGNSNIVGTHWFQFGDQATTGRGDGENYQIGLVDICDKPYPETIDAVRDVGSTMYRTRMRAGAAATITK